MLCLDDFENFEENLKCPICLDILSRPTATSCNHVFCKKCIEKSRSIKSTCPICKVPIMRRSSLIYVPIIEKIVLGYSTLKSKFENYQPNTVNTCKRKKLEKSNVPLLEDKENLPVNKKRRKNRVLSVIDVNENSLKELKEQVRFLKKQIEKSEMKSNKAKEELNKKYPKKTPSKKRIRVLENTEKNQRLISPSFTPSSVKKPSSKFLKKQLEGRVLFNHLSPLPLEVVEEENEIREKVLVGTLLDVSQKKELKKLITKLGGKYLNKYNSSVTHVVTPSDKNGRARRTMKYSYGILNGVWIVNFNWVKECLRHKEYLRENTYEIKGDVREIFGPRNGRIAKRRNSKALFHEKYFLFYGDFGEHGPSRSQLLDLVKYGKGIYVKSMPKKKDLLYPKKRGNSKSPPKTQDNVFIITDKVRTNKELTQVIRKTGVVPVTFSWLLDSVSHFRLLDTSDYEDVPTDEEE